MRDGAGFAGLAGGHVVENILHGPAVRQRALPHLRALAGRLFPLFPVASLTLVGVQQQDQLLLDKFPFLRVGRGGRAGRRDTGNTTACPAGDHTRVHAWIHTRRWKHRYRVHARGGGLEVAYRSHGSVVAGQVAHVVGLGVHLGRVAGR